MVKKYIVNPKWKEKNRVLVKHELLGSFDSLGMYAYEDYFPQEDPDDKDDSKVIKEGWLMVVKPPCTEIKIPALTIIYGKMVSSNSCNYKGFPFKLWEVKTKFGDLRLRMGEVRLIDISKYAFSIGSDYFIKFLGESHANKKVSDIIFYMQNRGLSKGSAIKLLLETDAKKLLGFVYFVAHIEYQKMFCRSGLYIAEDIYNREQIKRI